MSYSDDEELKIPGPEGEEELLEDDFDDALIDDDLLLGGEEDGLVEDEFVGLDGSSEY
jgi:hypothetical protein